MEKTGLIFPLNYYFPTVLQKIHAYVNREIEKYPTLETKRKLEKEDLGRTQCGILLKKYTSYF